MSKTDVWGRHRLPDFEVTITFLSPDEGGRKLRPFQGYRSDVMFPGDADVYMIHPEFLNPDGSLYPDRVPVPPQVRANMYVCYEEARPFYRGKIHVGQVLKIVEGTHPVGTAVVTEIKNLLNVSVTGPDE